MEHYGGCMPCGDPEFSGVEEQLLLLRGIQAEHHRTFAACGALNNCLERIQKTWGIEAQDILHWWSAAYEMRREGGTREIGGIRVRAIKLDELGGCEQISRYIPAYVAHPDYLQPIGKFSADQARAVRRAACELWGLRQAGLLALSVDLSDILEE